MLINVDVVDDSYIKSNLSGAKLYFYRLPSDC